MRTDLDLYIRPNTRFTLEKELVNNNEIELYKVEMSLDYPLDIEKLRGYKWDIVPCVTVESNAVRHLSNYLALNKIIEILAYGSVDAHKVYTRVTNVSEIENKLCGGWPTVEIYFNQLASLRKGKINYWYKLVPKWLLKYFDADEYLDLLREYTKDQYWHISDITEPNKDNILYEFTNTYNDLYY